ncbi:hypothetical protein, partial [Escherichia coli]
CGENITFHQVAKFSVPLQTPDIRSPAYLNKTRGIDCEWWDEVARWCQSTTRGRRLSLCLPQEDETRGLH